MPKTINYEDYILTTQGDFEILDITKNDTYYKTPATAATVRCCSCGSITKKYLSDILNNRHNSQVCQLCKRNTKLKKKAPKYQLPPTELNLPIENQIKNLLKITNNMLPTDPVKHVCRDNFYNRWKVCKAKDGKQYQIGAFAHRPLACAVAMLLQDYSCEVMMNYKSLLYELDKDDKLYV